MILDDLKEFKRTYNHFNKYVFQFICKSDRQMYHNFNKLPESTILFYLIGFLEKQFNTPITDAITFYSYQYEGTFKEKVIFMIKNEFYRIENDKKTNYLPF